MYVYIVYVEPLDDMGVSQKMKHEQFWDVWDVWPPDLGPAHARRNEWPPLQGNFQHVEKQSHLFPQKKHFWWIHGALHPTASISNHTKTTRIG